jgi:nucleoside-diphosphate-sugar epimerase
MSKTIAITGVSGFTGGAIARHYVNKGWRVLGFARRAVPIEGVESYQWDITTPTLPIRDSIDVVMHSAAKVGDFGPYAAFYQANVLGTQHVLDHFRDAGQFIHISSSSVYGPFAPEKRNIREDFPYGTRYLNAYGETKMLAEKLILSQARPNCVILRPRAIYGIGDTTLLPRLLRARRGNFLLGIGDGKNLISITYIENFLHALDCVIKKSFSQEIFNIADAQPLTLRELLTAFAETMEWKVQLLLLPTPLVLGMASLQEAFYKFLNLPGAPTLTQYGVHQLTSAYTLNIEKAQAMLSYAPVYSYREGFSAIKSWLETKSEISIGGPC